MPFVLSGISYPLRIEGGGLPAVAKGTDVIKSALTVLMRTNKGSRVMRPTLGTNLQRLIFENQGPVMQSLVQREVLLAISNFLPQVVVKAMDFVEDNRRIQVNVRYVVQGVLDQTGFVTIGQRT